LKCGVIEKVTSLSPEGLIKHYIPHHPVITPSKNTTKVRIIYDASAETKKDNKSLNECLYRGPPSLCGLLIRFRLSPVGVVGDIEKAFFNVGFKSKIKMPRDFYGFKTQPRQVWRTIFKFIGFVEYHLV